MTFGMILARVFLSVFPAILFTWNYSLVSLGNYAPLAFLSFCGIVVWSVWDVRSIDRVLEKIFRFSEVACFLMPVSVFVSSLQVANSAAGDADKVVGGMAVAGAILAGLLASFVSLMFSALFGVVFHLVANNFQKKSEQAAQKSISSQYGFLVVLVFVFVSHIVGFFAGVAKNFVGTSSGNTRLAGGSPPQLRKSLSKESSVADASAPQPIILKGATTEFIKMEYSFDDHFKITTKFQNNTRKNVKGFRGSLLVRDMFDNQIGAFEVEETKKLAKGQTKTFVNRYDYNQFLSDQNKMRESNGQLRYSFEVEKIVYADGTSESF